MGAELLQLRAHFGVSGTDALGVPGAKDPLPAWEYDLLVGALAETENESDEPEDLDIDPDRELADPPVPQGIPGL